MSSSQGSNESRIEYHKRFRIEDDAMAAKHFGRGLVLVVVAASFGAACKQSPTAPADVPLGQPFDLRAGQSAVVPGGLKVTFDRVVSDSRCPIDAICVTAGEARLALTLSAADAAPVLREVRADSAAPEVSYLAYTIRVIALQPYPRSDRTPTPEEFVATFSVRR